MIIHQIIIISMLVFAIHYTMLPGEIFGFIEKWWKGMEDKLSELADVAINRGDDNAAMKLLAKEAFIEKLSQPLFRCPVCMAPWHGTYLYWLIPWAGLGLPAHVWWHWPIIVIAALGLNSIIVRVFKDE